MSNSNDKPSSEADAELEREIRKERKFTLAEAIGRMAGPGAMKGVSPITRKQQAEVEIENWLRHRLTVGEGELQVVLLRWIKASGLLLNYYEQPLVALTDYCQQLLGSDARMRELVRETDAEWGRVQGERPYFDAEGASPHPDDPYTIDSVRSALSRLVEQLVKGDG
jgi:hypothetical protein